MNDTTVIFGLIQNHMVVFGLIVVWSLVWKILAMLRTFDRRDKAWFVVLLLVNTLGILEIIYYFVFSKKDYCCSKDKCDCELKMEDK
jgi:hypothetical protein